MPFPGRDDDAPPITVGEWGLLVVGALLAVFAVAVNLL